MVKKITLTELDPLKTNLITAVVSKIAAREVSDVNFDIQKKLKVDFRVVTDLLGSIEKKIREAEMIHHTWLKDADHTLLCKDGSTLPFTAELEFTYATNILKKTIEINDREFY